MSDHPGAAVPAGEAHAHAILDAALDAIITIDHHGHVLEFNRAAEQTFGRRKDEVLGRELATLIVPPEFREAHRRALARWTAAGPTAGAGRLLGRRVEVDAVRADGSRFPAELAISRVGVSVPPIFTACIRDLSERKDAEEQLRSAEFRYRTLVEQLPLITYVDSSERAVSKPLYLSPQVQSMLGPSPAEWIATPDLYQDLIHEDDREWVLAAKEAAYEKGEALRLEYRMVSSDGRIVWLEDQSVPVEPPEGGASFRQGFAIDITERKRAEDELRRAETRYRTLVEQLPLAVYIDRMDAASSNIYTSPQIEPMLGYPVDEWASNPGLFLEVLHPEDRERVLAAHALTHTTEEPLCIEYRVIAQDGRVVWVHDEARVIADHDDGAPVMQGYLLDVTERMEAEAELRHQAFHDSLTGLANRALFTDRVQHALVIGRLAGREAAVLFVDLDDFKTVNDTLGHSVGDELLKAVGIRLCDALSPRHTVARIGGDEFAILVEEDERSAAAADTAERLITILQSPFDIGGREIFVTASIGIAAGDGAEELLRSADVAMYRAKTRGGAQYAIYAPRMDEDVVGRLELVADLRRAQLDSEFVLHYQPVVELETGTIVGVEALVRWHHPTRGLLPPSMFIPLAEETGRIVEIGRWVLTEACRNAARWRAEVPGAEELRVSVNVSPRQMRRPGLLQDVRSALTESGLVPGALEIEITESVVASRRDEMTSILNSIAALGVRLALDDFGTGYSSLSLLQDLPVQALKIDRSFVSVLDAGAERVAFVRAIVDLAATLGLTVVAEGIEDRSQAAALLGLGCRLGQGFYLARPLEGRELEILLSAGPLVRPLGRPVLVAPHPAAA